MRLSPAVLRELTLQCKVGPQNTYGSARTRAQNTLVRAGLSRFVEIPDYGGTFCVATDAGRTELKDHT